MNLTATYLLPIRRAHGPASDELTTYLRWVSTCMPVLVVDGSSPAVFAAHAAAWGGFAQHRGVDADLAARNGKVAACSRGCGTRSTRRSSSPTTTCATTTPRSPRSCARSTAAHVVRPQNYFDPLPWHALWDTGRMLLNRALGGDWPGTLACAAPRYAPPAATMATCCSRTSSSCAPIVAAGGRERIARDVFVRRVPPPSAHFWSQRVRQAYDEFARPWRLAAQLALLPALGLLPRAGARVPAVVATGVIVAVAERGRRRDGGRRVFPAAASALRAGVGAERAVAAGSPLASRVLRGGVPYAGSTARARRHAAAARARGDVTPARVAASTSIGLNVPLFDSSAEQAVTPTMRSISARSSR